MQREPKIPKFKRCKIAQPQLNILMQSFGASALERAPKIRPLSALVAFAPTLGT